MTSRSSGGPRRTVRSALLAAVVSCAIVTNVRAQDHVLIVNVADAANGRPLEGAQVRLPQLGRVARADWIGEARFYGLSTGKHSVQVRMVGYAPSDIEVMATGDTVGAVFMLEQSGRTLDTVRVTASAFERRLAEFRMHQSMGIGRFLTDSALAREGTRSVALVLISRLPGFKLEPVPEAPGRDSLMAVKPSGLMHSPSFGCPVLIYLDGFLVQNGLESIHTNEVIGIEVYDIEAAPVQYRRPGSACKVVLFWSKPY